MMVPSLENDPITFLMAATGGSNKPVSLDRNRFMYNRIPNFCNEYI